MITRSGHVEQPCTPHQAVLLLVCVKVFECTCVCACVPHRNNPKQPNKRRNMYTNKGKNRIYVDQIMMMSGVKNRSEK